MLRKCVIESYEGSKEALKYKISLNTIDKERTFTETEKSTEVPAPIAT